MAKVAKEPVSPRQALWIAGLSASAGALLVLVSTGNVSWLLSKLWSQEAAGWAAALATVGAIWVALTAAEREHARTIKLRDEQWQREEQHDQERASALAHVFHRELLEAAGDLYVFIHNTSDYQLRHEFVSVRQFLLHGDVIDRLPLMRRFADQLRGFSATDQFNILSALSSWQPFANSLPSSLDEAPDLLIRAMARDMRVTAIGTRVSFYNLQCALEKYMYAGKADLRPAPRIDFSGEDE